MSLRHSYTLLAPLYDLAIARFTERARRDSIARLGDATGEEILLSGVGSGLDLPHLPRGARYHGIDLTPAMLRRASARARELQLDISLQQGDAMALPFEDGRFDSVILHLIVAVVPEPERVLAEAARVVRPGGRIVLLDKFLHPGQYAPLRRLLNLLSRHVATRTDVVFEPLLAALPTLRLVDDRPALAGGWFRSIELQREE